MKYDYLVVGAGFAGSVCAERLSAQNKSVLMIDSRNHIGGNAYDEHDKSGILVHRYGPHIFHTNSKKIFEYLSQFTDWRFYEHRVLAALGEKLYPIPINRTTINALYGLNLSEAEVQEFIDQVSENIQPVCSSEDVVLNSVGKDLCEKFFRNYTRKQWSLDLSELSAGVASRIPTRTNDDDRYFSDTYQFMPAKGYTKMFEKMLSNPNIDIQLETKFEDIVNTVVRRHTIYTGPIDAFFEYRYGELPYRSIRFEHEHLASTELFQQTGTVNYPNEHQFTRITEFKHLTGQVQEGTSIVREFPCSQGAPYYPIPRRENEAVLKKYQALAKKRNDVTFVGRLAQYRYYNMDQVVGAALTVSQQLLKEQGFE